MTATATRRCIGGRQKGRIDALSAAVLAVGLGSRRQTAGGSWAFHEAEFDNIETGEFHNEEVISHMNARRWN